MGVIVRLRCREVALAGKGRAGRWCRAVRYDSLGLNKRHRAAAPLFGFVMDSVDLGHRRIGAFLTTPHLLRLLALGSLSLDSGIGRSLLLDFGFPSCRSVSNCHRGLAVRLRVVPYLPCAGFSLLFV